MEAQCICCGKYFSARRKDQCYCFRKECRRQRKNAFQKKKLTEDPAYRQNQADAQRRWRERNKGYWREYRESHPWYAERNRRLQRVRNKGRGKGPFLRNRGPLIANMDAQPIDISGTYRLIPVNRPMIAKMDDMVVRLSLVAKP